MGAAQQKDPGIAKPHQYSSRFRSILRDPLLVKGKFQSDNYEMARLLEEQLLPITSLDEKDEDIYGWAFRSGEIRPQSKVTEMNLFFLGTGSMPHFGKHRVMSEGGDVLCHLALQKGVVSQQPSLIIKGVGTVTLNKNGSSEIDKNYPLQSLLNPEIAYAGKVSQIMLGHGIKQRLKVAMETFFIPNLMKMIQQNERDENGHINVEINVVGHSRGAITGFHMITGIENWLTLVKNESHLLDIQQLSTMCHLPQSEIIHAIEMIKSRKVNCKINSLSFDPVEGKCRTQDVKKWFSHDTSMPVNISGIAKSIDTHCSSMPESVASAQVYFAKSERRWDFRPTVPEFAKNTKVNYKIELGTHSTMIGNIGDDDGTGQDAYQTIQKYPFVKEAALACIDKVKLDAAQFLFKKDLPPLQRHTLRRIFRKSKTEQDYAYQHTLAYLEQALIQNMQCNRDFNAYIDSVVKILYPKDSDIDVANLMKTHADLRIRCCEWLMKSDPKLTMKTYALLEKEIQDRYLHSSDPELRGQLNEWQEEMKRDSSTLIAGPLTGVKYLRLPLQRPDEERQIYLRKGTVKLSKHSLEEFVSQEGRLKRELFTILNSIESRQDKKDKEFSVEEISPSLLIGKKMFSQVNVVNDRDISDEPVPKMKIARSSI